MPVHVKPAMLGYRLPEEMGEGAPWGAQKPSSPRGYLGEVFVLDNGNKRIQVFSTAGGVPPRMGVRCDI